MANAKQTDADVVALSKAIVAGQIVKGSSDHSRYVCVVVGKHVNMAGRLTGASLSVRVEPWEGREAEWQSYKPALQNLGLTVHKTGGYASVHLAAPTPEQAVMGLAAFMAGFVLFAGGVYLPLSELPGIAGKGV